MKRNAATSEIRFSIRRVLFGLMSICTVIYHFSFVATVRVQFHFSIFGLIFISSLLFSGTDFCSSILRITTPFSQIVTLSSAFFLCVPLISFGTAHWSILWLTTRKKCFFFHTYATRHKVMNKEEKKAQNFYKAKKNAFVKCLWFFSSDKKLLVSLFNENKWCY